MVSEGNMVDRAELEQNHTAISKRKKQISEKLELATQSPEVGVTVPRWATCQNYVANFETRLRWAT